jgi:hypothetical protein
MYVDGDHKFICPASIPDRVVITKDASVRYRISKLTTVVTMGKAKSKRNNSSASAGPYSRPQKNNIFKFNKEWGYGLDVLSLPFEGSSWDRLY